MFPLYEPQLRHNLTFEGCASACHHSGHTMAGLSNGTDCFCGDAADLATPGAKARSLPKPECEVVPCVGDTRQKGCGGDGLMLAYAFTCDRTEHEVRDEVRAGVGHNPPYSFSMHIEVSY